MKVIRDEDAVRVFLRVSGGDYTIVQSHFVFCAVAGHVAGSLLNSPGRVRFGLQQFDNGTPDDLRAYARELLELADIADALQAEMAARYTKEYGGQADGL